MSHRILYIISIYTLLVFSVSAAAQTQGMEELKQRIEAYVHGKQAQIGVALIIGGKETVTVNDTCRYPLMSVFKFHQALAVADYLQHNGLQLDTLLYIRKEELKPNTYSPLRDKYPEGNRSLSVKELLTYTLQLSDNNACDILFDRLVDVEKTDRYIRSLGINDFSITANEDAMHQDLETCYDNWSYPSAVARLFELLVTKELFATPYQAFIKQTLIACETGKDRLAKPLIGTQAVIGHKTGTGDRNARGAYIGINDAGFVLLPDGRHYTLTVLIKDSEASMEETSKMIAEISGMVYRALAEERSL